MGYSLNDTIIVYDRIRENLKAIPENGPKPSMDEIINHSLNQTLARTILTSGTTLVTCISLYVLGGSVIHDFSLTLLLGILFGTFSSHLCGQPRAAGPSVRWISTARLRRKITITNVPANTASCRRASSPSEGRTCPAFLVKSPTQPDFGFSKTSGYEQVIIVLFDMQRRGRYLTNPVLSKSICAVWRVEI